MDGRREARKNGVMENALHNTDNYTEGKRDDRGGVHLKNDELRLDLK